MAGRGGSRCGSAALPESPDLAGDRQKSGMATLRPRGCRRNGLLEAVQKLPDKVVSAWDVPPERHNCNPAPDRPVVPCEGPTVLSAARSGDTEVTV